MRKIGGQVCRVDPLKRGGGAEGRQEGEGHTARRESYQKLVQSQDGWRKACNNGNREGEGEVLESVRVEDEGACGTVVRSALRPGPRLGD